MLNFVILPKTVKTEIYDQLIYSGCICLCQYFKTKIPVVSCFKMSFKCSINGCSLFNHWSQGLVVHHIVRPT